jgi:hypothetical protein
MCTLFLCIEIPELVAEVVRHDIRAFQLLNVGYTRQKCQTSDVGILRDLDVGVQTIPDHDALASVEVVLLDDHINRPAFTIVNVITF